MMSQSKHTPGPWSFFAEEAGDEADEISQVMADMLGQTDSSFGVCTENGTTVAYTHFGENGGQSISLDEAEANARLIAAAPELLEALKWQKDQSCEGFCRDWPEAGTYTPEMDDLCAGCRARSVIVKATAGAS